MPDTKTLLFSPNISINGPIQDQTVAFFLERLQAVRDGAGDLIMELNTLGGDADAARRIALEVRLFIRHSGRQACCVGKTNIYSAGITIFAAFPKSCRFLTDDAILLIHERRLQSSIELNGPMQSNLQILREQLAMVETARELEMAGFRELADGSTITADELYERAKENCYLTAREALELGLIVDILS